MGELEQDALLCPVRALKYYLRRTKEISPRPANLFVSPNCRLRAMSNSAISSFLRETIVNARAVGVVEGHAPRAHSIWGMSTSITFNKNWSIKQVLRAATWKSNSTFVSYYLKDVAYVLGGLSSLGPLCLQGKF